jgi:hypothetical protein
MVEMSGDAVCGLHHAQGDEERGFPDLASKPRLTVSPGLAAKSVASGFPVWASNLTAMVWWFGPQNHCDGFLVWASKPKGLPFVGCATKPMEDEDGARHTSRFSGLLRLKASRARVSQSDLKTSGGAARMVHVVSSWRLRGDEAEEGQTDVMGYIRLFYLNFIFSLY